MGLLFLYGYLYNLLDDSWFCGAIVGSLLFRGLGVV